MPALPKLKVACLAELAQQLRFGTPEAARRQMVRSERLALELLGEGVGGRRSVQAEARAYPEPWIRFRITGLRPEARADTGTTMVVGEALLADLSGLVQRLSAAANIRESDLLAGPITAGRGTRSKLEGPRTALDARRGAGLVEKEPDGPWFDAAAVCQRWGVGRKTLERLRRRGLCGRLVIRARGGRKGGASRKAVLFSREFVEACEAAGLLDQTAHRRAGARARVGASVRARMRRWATGYERRLGWGRMRSIERIAARTGWSISAVRRALAEDRQGAVRASVSRAGRYRAGAAHRLDRLRMLDLSGINAGPVAQVFMRADAAEVLLGARPVRTGLGRPAPITPHDLLRTASLLPPPDAETELARTAAYWFLRWRAGKATERLAGGSAKTAAIDRAETDLRWATLLKVELVRSQLAVMIRTVEQAIGRELAAYSRAAAVLQEAIVTAGDAVERFDPFRDWGSARLAAQTTMSVNRGVTRWLAAREQSGADTGRAVRLQRDREGGLGGELEIAWRRLNPWQAWLEPSIDVRPHLGSAHEDVVLARRMGWLGGAPVTAAELAEELGTTPTRIVVLEKLALRKAAGAEVPRRG